MVLRTKFISIIKKENITHNSPVDSDMTGSRKNGIRATSIEMGLIDDTRLRLSTEMDAMIMINVFIVHLKICQEPARDNSQLCGHPFASSKA